MPLPDATPPEKSRLYEELKSKTALLGASSAVTPDLLDNLLNQLFLDYENEDELRRHLLVGLVTNAKSSAGPIPNSFFIDKIQSTSSGSIIKGFNPGVGEVWQLVGAISTNGSGTSGTITLEVKLFDKANSRRAEIIQTTTTTGTDNPMTEVTQNPVFLDENCEIEFEATGTFTEMNAFVPLIRVR